MGDSAAECETANLHKWCFGFPCNIARVLYIILFAKQTKCCGRKRKSRSYFFYSKRHQKYSLICISFLPWNQTSDLRLKIFLLVGRQMSLRHETKEKLWNQTAPRALLWETWFNHTGAMESPSGFGSPLVLRGLQHSERITPIVTTRTLFSNTTSYKIF